MLEFPLDNKVENAVEVIKTGVIDLVINIPKNYQEEELTNDYLIRRAAVDFKVPIITNRQVAMRLAEALFTTDPLNLGIRSWDEYK
jgi:carbamoyl-phosphate synthase large subunit